MKLHRESQARNDTQDEHIRRLVEKVSGPKAGGRMQHRRQGVAKSGRHGPKPISS